MAFDDYENSESQQTFSDIVSRANAAAPAVNNYQMSERDEWGKDVEAVPRKISTQAKFRKGVQKKSLLPSISNELFGKKQQAPGSEKNHNGKGSQNSDLT